MYYELSPIDLHAGGAADADNSSAALFRLVSFFTEGVISMMNELMIG
uniref:Uncharacterized protein n=2 Tax=Aegilops tauschii subsp. strangulata TaxID=200361 RepID=A0A453D9T7_AEGTS